MAKGGIPNNMAILDHFGMVMSDRRLRWYIGFIHLTLQRYVS